MSSNWLNKFAITILDFYKKVISPFLPQACRFHPTCSVYSRECFEQWSFVYALFLTLRRLLKCHPFHPGGMDPSPKPPK